MDAEPLSRCSWAEVWIGIGSPLLSVKLGYLSSSCRGVTVIYIFRIHSLFHLTWQSVDLFGVWRGQMLLLLDLAFWFCFEAESHVIQPDSKLTE